MVQPLKNYVLYPPDVIVQDDDRDWELSWQHHLERTNGQRGGIDLVAQAPGVPIRAATAGVVQNIPGPAGAGINQGNVITLTHDSNPGWKDVYEHVNSEWFVADGTHVEQGEIIGTTGNSGNVPYHLHRHLLDPDGRRQNPHYYWSKEEPVPEYRTLSHRGSQPVDSGDWSYLEVDGDAANRRLNIEKGEGTINCTIYAKFEEVPAGTTVVGEFVRRRAQGEGDDKDVTIDELGEVEFVASGETVSIHAAVNVQLRETDVLRFRVRHSNKGKITAAAANTRWLFWPETA